MTDDEVRESWRVFREHVVRQERDSKQSGGAVFAEFARYRSLSAEERKIIDGLAIEEIRSPDQGVRFDYLALVREFHLKAAIPALEDLAMRLSHRDDPVAALERKKVLGIIDMLKSD